MDWKLVFREGLVAGSLGSLLSSLVLLACGRRDAGSAVAPVNAVSHWLWGRESLRTDRMDARHTLAGYATHHAASVFWASLHAAAAQGRPATRQAAVAVAGAAATSAIACLVDYRVVPKRLTPGFEHRISPAAMTGVYVALAVGLAAGALLARRARRCDPTT
ncbi:MAG: hypothetical protein HY854_04305 [Burkholderiales bacterium]|nr:hypothetical protein [Burkholderiales bacterium]